MKVDIALGEMTECRALHKAMPACVDLEELLATRLLVQGNSGSGKSHLLRRLLEQSAAWVQHCVIDPEGDFVTLADKFDHVVVEAQRSERELTRIAHRIRQHRVSVVFNLEGLDTEQQMRAVGAFLGALFDVERDYWYPMLVVVDEAQLFAPAVAGEVSDEARKISLGAMTNLMCRGRKRGLAGVIATQRLAKLAKNVAAEASNFLIGRTFLDIDMVRAADLLGMERRQAEMFRDLERGHFVALGPALSRRPLPIVIGPVETLARSTSPKLMPLPTERVDVKELVFTASPEEILLPFKQSREMAREPVREKSVHEILEEVAHKKQESLEEEPSLFSELSAVDRDIQAEHVIREILDDPEAFYRSTAVLYQDFLVRCRIHGHSGQLLNLAQFRRKLAVAQADVDEETAVSENWKRILHLSESLEDDVQGVFLNVAQAALSGKPCPSDAFLARLYGTHSLSRARRLLTYFEERGLVVVHTHFNGQRIVAFPDLGIETAPGDPKGPA
ncbi:ATP-binding protein [Bartonella machadoae]|uniref:ATP-binding protein n=1 Tax=Bartonella machadoae TaxID=2893471 RepID=UPI001F4CD2F0|nr:ATP-binding protein [Bartonella machadoae]UNE53741.1 ATP-binding protein [Bartonella machadoae]